MKHEWRKHEKNLYGVKQYPRIVNIPKQQFIMINGKGNPNKEDFSNKVSVLFSLAYAIKMLYKNTSISKEICDYTVYPLEAIWKTIDNAKFLDKNQLEYTVMIRQPDFITKDMFLDALERVKIKKTNELYKEIYFDTIHDEKCIEILHIGAYDDEPMSFQKMDLLAKENNLNSSINYHREIYLNNENRVFRNKLKTILRYCVE
ncbi:GyrI-like domain-containing protein [Clostridium perfringens]|uniref:GyrI-like domain-containing protein n=1 Tax=Clostridium perfringens TaxID=1502 RepID=UPI0024BC8109|nr:GyrI-like domain-containing protein [Clostridium perfringens]